MQIININRTHYLEDCTIEGYKGFFIQWELTAEGANNGSIMDLCQKYCHNEKFTREQFLNSLDYAISQCRKSYRAAFHIKSFCSNS